MTERMKITGTAIGMDTGDPSSDIDLSFEFPLRDLFAAFALAGLAANDVTAEGGAGTAAYKLADAAIVAREGNCGHEKS